MQEIMTTLSYQLLPHEGLTPTKDGGKCLRRLSMFRKEVHYSSLSFVFAIFYSLSWLSWINFSWLVDLWL